MPFLREQSRIASATSATGFSECRAERSCLTIADEFPLDHLPEVGIDDRFVLAGIDLALVSNFAPVDRVLQQGIESAAREPVSTRQDATGTLAPLADNADPVEFVAEQPDRSEFRIAPEDHAHRLGFGVIDDQLAVLNVIAERDIATHPHALSLGGGNFVTDTLTGDLTLELRKREQHVEREAPH